jgi:hypothetical protein
MLRSTLTVEPLEIQHSLLRAWLFHTGPMGVLAQDPAAGTAVIPFGNVAAPMKSRLKSWDGLSELPQVAASPLLN